MNIAHSSETVDLLERSNIDDDINNLIDSIKQLNSEISAISAEQMRMDAEIRHLERVADLLSWR